MEKSQDHEGWMESLENMFPVVVARTVLPKYLRSLVSIASLFSPKIRRGIPSMRTLEIASIECVTKRQAQLQRNGSTRQDMLAKALSLYDADIHDEKKIPQQKMLLEDVHMEAFIAMYG